MNDIEVSKIAGTVTIKTGDAVFRIWAVDGVLVIVKVDGGDGDMTINPKSTNQILVR